MLSKHLNWFAEDLDATQQAGVYVSLRELIALRFKATGFSFLPKQPVQSLLHGSHASRLRGRGLNFEEIRQYQLGDDIRAMDWKVTARTLKPHVRVYSEERDRPIFFVLDQRINMFFGSVREMKSVTAAQVAALGAWRALASGDRVGGCVINDTQTSVIKPRQSQANLYQLLEHVTAFNHALTSSQDHEANLEQLNQALQLAGSELKHDGLCCVITDGFGFNAKTLQYLTSLASNNNVIWCHISDPMEASFPTKGEFIAGDSSGQLHVALNQNQQHQYATQYSAKLNTLTQRLQSLRVPLLMLSTHLPVPEQLRQQFGYYPKTPSARV